jgi:sugar-phosphatase
MPERSFDAVIFDMDGVLIDSGDVYERHWTTWALKHGVDLEDIRRVHPGRPPASTISEVAPHLDAAAEAARFNSDLGADDASEEITLMPGAMELLDGLPSSRWTIATSALRVIAERWLASVGLRVPAELVSVDDVERGKPWPDPYLRAARLLDVDPQHCLVIEDAPAGITAAKAAGATVLALRTTHAPDELAEADATVQDLGVVSMLLHGERWLVRWQDQVTPAADRGRETRS